jgi:hypothetical protein
MASVSWFLAKGAGSRPRAPNVLTDYRARQAIEEYERAERKRLDLAEQHCPLNPPAVRIRAWEKMHGLCLPSDPAHPILDVIAAGTRLTPAEVQAEQRARFSQTNVTRSGCSTNFEAVSS